MAKLIIIRGLPGSGKSTLAKSLTRFKHFEADQYFEGKDGIYHFDPTKLHEAHEYCQNAVHEALQRGEDVVVSNTFTRHWEYLPYILMCDDLHITPHIVVCKSNFGSVHNLPIEAYHRMRCRWED